MHAAPESIPNVKQVVPFFRVADMDRSVRFYTDGVGFSMKNKWVVDSRIKWCWLELGGAALMLQEYRNEGPQALTNKGIMGLGVSLSFQCEDALSLYHGFKSRGIAADEPFVGNSMWVTHFCDPDGYRLEFESPTAVPEETKLSDLKL